MLTPRGWWFLVAAAVLAVGGTALLAAVDPFVPLLGLCALGWFLAGWLRFVWRVRLAAGRVTVRREVLVGGRVTSVVWAGSNPTVRLTVALESGRLPHLTLTDRPPGDLPTTEPDELVGELRADAPAVAETAIHPTAPGVLRFEGVELTADDPCGFFQRRWFVRHVTELPVLPSLLPQRSGRQRGVKRANALPPPGQYRLRRPGGGGELLDLRDYRPGDPPKTIAWKASARRDRLITKEFESDVPVRCVMLLDASNGARVGPAGETPVARLAAVAAGVAQAAAAGRDLIGLTVCDDAGSESLSPARTAVHRVRVLKVLAEAAGRLPAAVQPDATRLVRPAHDLAAAVYPDLLADDVNARPLGLFWRPVTDSNWGWLVLTLLVLPLGVFSKAVLERVAKVATAVAPTGYGWAALAVLLLLPWVLAGGIWGLHGVRGLLPPVRQQTSKRKGLAALFAAADGTGPAMVERYLKDDAAFAERAGRFLSEHRVRVPLTLTGVTGENLYRSPGKAATLAAALTRAVAVARDNELYVILADLAELTADELAPLLAAVRTARARHHTVLLVLPWPSEVPADPPPLPAGAVKLATLVRHDLEARYHRGYAAVRGLFASAGVRVLRVQPDDPVPMVLDRLDRLRGVGARR